MKKTTPVKNLQSSRKRKQHEVIDLTNSPTKSPKIANKRSKNDLTAQSSPVHRPKRYRDHPPQNVLVKQERVMTQRMFLIERSGRKDGSLEEDFSVLGSTGNVYMVKVSQIPSCTCPDFLKHQVHCKHILFVFLKVLKIPEPLWYQAAFITSVSPPRESLLTARNWKKFLQGWRIVDTPCLRKC